MVWLYYPPTSTECVTILFDVSLVTTFGKIPKVDFFQKPTKDRILKIFQDFAEKCIFLDDQRPEFFGFQLIEPRDKSGKFTCLILRQIRQICLSQRLGEIDLVAQMLQLS